MFKVEALTDFQVNKIKSFYLVLEDLKEAAETLISWKDCIVNLVVPGKILSYKQRVKMNIALNVVPSVTLDSLVSFIEKNKKNFKAQIYDKTTGRIKEIFDKCSEVLTELQKKTPSQEKIAQSLLDISILFMQKICESNSQRKDPF